MVKKIQKKNHLIFYVDNTNQKNYFKNYKICYFKNLCIEQNSNGEYEIKLGFLYSNIKFSLSFKLEDNNIKTLKININKPRTIIDFVDENGDKIKVFDDNYYIAYYFNDKYDFKNNYSGTKKTFNISKFVDLQFVFYKVSNGDSEFSVKPEHIIKYMGNTSNNENDDDNNDGSDKNNEDLKNILIIDSKLRYNHNKLWALIYLYITRFIKVCKCCHCCNGKYKIYGHCLCPKCKFDCLINFHTIIKPLNLTKDELIFYNTCLRHILISDLKLKKMLIEYLDKKGIKYRDFINNDEELFNLLN